MSGMTEKTPTKGVFSAKAGIQYLVNASAALIAEGSLQLRTSFVGAVLVIVQAERKGHIK
jgi:hypothetical protein